MKLKNMNSKVMHCFLKTENYSCKVIYVWFCHQHISQQMSIGSLPWDLNFCYLLHWGSCQRKLYCFRDISKLQTIKFPKVNSIQIKVNYVGSHFWHGKENKQTQASLFPEMSTMIFIAVKNKTGLNCRIPNHLFACHWIWMVSFVFVPRSTKRLGIYK